MGERKGINQRYSKDSLSVLAPLRLVNTENKLVLVHTTEAQLHSFLTPALEGSEYSTPRSCTPGIQPQYPLNRRLDGTPEPNKNFAE